MGGFVSRGPKSDISLERPPEVETEGAGISPEVSELSTAGRNSTQNECGLYSLDHDIAGAGVELTFAPIVLSAAKTSGASARQSDLSPKSPLISSLMLGSKVNPSRPVLSYLAPRH